MNNVEYKIYRQSGYDPAVFRKLRHLFWQLKYRALNSTSD